MNGLAALWNQFNSFSLSLAERTERLNYPLDHFLIAPAWPSANEFEIVTIEKETAKAFAVSFSIVTISNSFADGHAGAIKKWSNG